MKNNSKLIRKVTMIIMSLSLLLLFPSQDYVLQEYSSIEITKKLQLLKLLFQYPSALSQTLPVINLILFQNIPLNFFSLLQDLILV